MPVSLAATTDVAYLAVRETGGRSNVGFDRLAVTDFEADPTDPAPAIKTCVERIRAV